MEEGMFIIYIKPTSQLQLYPHWGKLAEILILDRADGSHFIVLFQTVHENE